MLIIENILQEERDGYIRASADFRVDNYVHNIYFKWRGSKCPNPADAFMAAGLIPAMRLGKKLIVRGAVSYRLFKSIEIIQDIYKCWVPDLSYIKIEIDALIPEMVGFPPENFEFESMVVEITAHPEFQRMLKNIKATLHAPAQSEDHRFPSLT